MRSMWSGSVTFGLVSIPVGIHAAIEASREVHFRQLHRTDMAPIRYKKFCSEENVEVSNDEIVKGYEVRKGEYAPVEKEELENVQKDVGEGDRTIDILQFVDFASLNPLFFEKPYYLSPGRGGQKAYEVLRTALLGEKRVGIARFYLRTRPLLAALMAGPEVLSLEIMHEFDELRLPESLAAGRGSKPTAGELKMARSLINSMFTTWDPTAHPNTYRHALEKVLASKRKFAVPAKTKPAGRGKGKVVDLMEVLKASVEQTGRQGPASDAGGRQRGRRTRSRRRHAA